MSEAAAPRPNSVRARRKIDAAVVSIAFAAIVTLVIIGLTAMLLAQGYREQFVRAESRAEGDAHIVAVHSQWVLEASLQALERIRDNLQLEDGWPTAQTYGDINDQLSGLPDYVRIAVYGPQGNLRLSNAEDVERINVADESFFSQLAEGAPIVVSPMTLGDTVESTGFVVGRRLDRNGEFVGVAAITVSNSMLSNVWQSLDLEAGSTISLIREDGWIIARYPPPQEVISIADYELFTEHLPQASIGTYAADASPIDGRARVVGYRELETLPLVAVAAISTDEMVARYWGNATTALALIAPGLIGLLAALWWLLRILKRDRDTRQKLATALEHNKVLFREIHHRVKNNLQAVSALVSLQPVSSEAKTEMSRRIAAMVAVHEHIYRTDQFDSAEASEYLERLVADIVVGFDTNAEIRTDLEQVHVHRDHLMPLGLIANEALCNAIKYAFPDNKGGTISISLHKTSEMAAELRIQDDGIGFDQTAPSEGMGRRLVTGLARQMEGVVSYENLGKGTALSLLFPIQSRDEET